jgi:hypothetical protein
MTRRTAYLVSLKYSPGLRKLFETIGTNLAKAGVPMRYLLAAKYSALAPPLEGTHNVTAADTLPGMLRETAAFLGRRAGFERWFPKEPGFVCFFNPHALNLFLARYLRRRWPEAVVSIYLHEAFMTDKAAFGPVRAALFMLIEAHQAMVARRVHTLIAPSEYAEAKIRIRFPFFTGPVHLAPLLIPDRSRPAEDSPRFVSLIGMANDATGHDDFFRFVNDAAARNRDIDFAVASTSDLGKYAGVLEEGGRRRIAFLNKSVLLDREIEDVIRQSYAVLKLSKGLTQSAVVAEAFMQARPVIARDIPGLRQHVRHGENGYLLPYNFSNDDLWEAISFVRANFEVLSANARRDYERIWAEKNFSRYYGWLVEMMRNAEESS